VTPRESFTAATQAFLTLVERIPAEAYDGPGLGAWDLRALVGHTSRSLVTVEEYVDRVADTVAVDSAEDYYVLAAGADPVAVRGRGVDAGAAMGDDPVAFVRSLAERVPARIASLPDDHVLVTIAGAMRLDDYLETRVFELVVHGLDIARATGLDAGLDAGLPEALLAQTLALAGRVATRKGDGVDVLLALTGRTSLPEAFSVV
jgi:uncharacterized protein (TIGR03083 family)